MILRQVNYDDNEIIDTVTVTMSRNEAIALVNVAGKMNDYATSKLGLTKDDSLYDCIANLFNSEDEDGYPQLNIELGTLNDNER